MSRTWTVKRCLITSLVGNAVLLAGLCLIASYARDVKGNPPSAAETRQLALNAEAREIRSEIAVLREQKGIKNTALSPGSGWGIVPVSDFSGRDLIFQRKSPTKLNEVAIKAFGMDAETVSEIEEVMEEVYGRMRMIQRENFTVVNAENPGYESYKIAPPADEIRELELELSSKVRGILGEQRGRMFSNAVLEGRSFLTNGRRTVSLSFGFTDRFFAFQIKFPDGSSSAMPARKGSAGAGYMGFEEVYGHLFDFEAARRAALFENGNGGGISE